MFDDPKISTRVRAKAMKLARSGMCVDTLAARLRIPLIDAKQIIEQAQQLKQIDPDVIWAADRRAMELNSPTKTLFVQLFADHRAAKHDNERQTIRTRIILESTNLIRGMVARHVAKLEKVWEFDDLESTCTVAVIEEVDRLLAKSISHTNPGSMLIEKIHATIFDPDPDLHSRPHIVVKPRGKKAKHKRVETSWPRGVEVRDANKHFTADKDREGFDPAAPKASNDDDWPHLIELFEAGVISDSEIQLLDCLLQGHTQGEAADVFATNISAIKTSLTRIKSKIQEHEKD